ncbi:YetF domain-containing protein [Micromonospora chokoriensis]
MVLKNPADLLRLLVVAAIVYPALVLILRLSGKRTLSKLNAFDFVVTVALGSTLATILLSRDVSLVEGILALALLVTLQYLAALLAVRWPPSQRLLKARPTMLLRDGQLRHAALRRARVAESEIRQAARSHGTGDLTELAAVVLETDGSLSVIARDKLGDASSLDDVLDHAG